MISAGDPTKPPSMTQDVSVQHMVCGRAYNRDYDDTKPPEYRDPAKPKTNLENASCESTYRTVYDKVVNPAGMNENATRIFYYMLTLWNDSAANTCKSEVKYPPGAAGAGPRQKLIACTSKAVEGGKTFEFEGKTFNTFEEALNYFVQRAKFLAANPDSGDVPIPPDLQKYIDSIEGIDGGRFARETRRLFREGIARIRPPSHKIEEKFEARFKVGDQVKTEMEKHVKAFTDASAEQNKTARDKKQEAVRDKLTNTFVSNTGPKPAWVLTFGIVPAELIPPNTSEPMAQILRRLYAQALPIYINNGGQLDANGSAPSLAAALRREAAEKTRNMPDQADKREYLRSVNVGDVVVGADKKAERVVFKEPAAGDTGTGRIGHAPPELYTRLDAGSDPAKRTAIDYVWEQITTNFRDSKVNMTDAMEDKIVDNLAPVDRKPGKNNLHERSALDIARMIPVVNPSTGAVTLKPVSGEAFNSNEDHINRRGSGAGLATPSTGEVELVIRVHRHYLALLRDAKARPELHVASKNVAGILGASIAPLIHPGEPGEPDTRGDYRLQFFMTHKPQFKLVDGKVVVDWVKTDGSDYKPGSGVGWGDPNGVHGKTTGSGMASLTTVHGARNPNAPDSKLGNEHVGIFAMVDLAVKIFTNGDERFYISPKVGVLGLSVPSMACSGVAGGPESMNVNDCGPFNTLRLNEVSTEIAYAVGKGENGSKTVLGLIAGLLGSTRILEPIHQTFDSSTQPGNGYWSTAFGGSNNLLGGRLFLAFNGPDAKRPSGGEAPEVSGSVRLTGGSANTRINALEPLANGGTKVILDGNFGVEGPISGDLEGGLSISAGVGTANGNKPAGPDPAKDPEVPDAFTGGIYGGALAAMMRYRNFRLKVTVLHDRQSHQNSPDMKRTGVGGMMDFPVLSWLDPYIGVSNIWYSGSRTDFPGINDPASGGKGDPNVSSPNPEVRAAGQEDTALGSKTLEVVGGTKIKPHENVGLILGAYWLQNTANAGSDPRQNYGLRTGFEFSF